MATAKTPPRRRSAGRDGKSHIKPKSEYKHIEPVKSEALEKLLLAIAENPSAFVLPTRNTNPQTSWWSPASIPNAPRKDYNSQVGNDGRGATIADLKTISFTKTHNYRGRKRTTPCRRHESYLLPAVYHSTLVLYCTTITFIVLSRGDQLGPPFFCIFSK